MEIKLKEIGFSGFEWINVAKDNGDVLIKTVLIIQV